MAHNLYVNKEGKVAMAYVGEPPWHGLGQRLQGAPTAREVMRAAHLDWTVSKKPLWIWAEGEHRRVPGRFIIVPDDRWGKENCPIYGVVQNSYQPLQNAEAFEFFDPVIQSEKATYETAGALGEGERVWVLVRMRSSMRVAGSDEVAEYVLLSNSHDGKSSVQIKFTPIRVVCQNTLNQALSFGRQLQVEHRRGLWARLRDVQEMFGWVEDRFARIEKAFQAMAKVQMVGKRLEQYLAEVFPEPEMQQRGELGNGVRVVDTYGRRGWGQGRDAAKEREKERRQVIALRDQAARLFEEGRGNSEPPVRGTLWAAYNGVVEMIDYYTPFRTTESLLRSLWFGDRHLAKVRALRVGEAKTQEWMAWSQS